jgi:diguanylate cyclase (GGDEF)-like protein
MAAPAQAEPAFGANCLSCHSQLQTNKIVVLNEDATADPRFAANPLVTGAPRIGAYAGVAIEDDAGRRVGSLLLRLWGTALSVMVLDAVVFTALVAADRPTFASLLTGSLAAKTAGATFYTLLVTLYIRMFERQGDSAHAPDAPRDVFRWLTYRQRYEEVRSLMARDALTGLYNRGYFTERLEAEAVRALRTGQAMALLMIDADEFKSINDRYGHPVGDRVLQQIAQACQSSLRPYDLLARFGGEEFVVLLPETTLSQACEVAERVIAAVASVEPETMSVEPLRVTVSVGVAVLSSTDSGGSALLQRADAALYQAKRNGRNTWAC